MTHASTVLVRPRTTSRTKATGTESWTCENCETVNEVRRRRCGDCRTSRW